MKALVVYDSVFGNTEKIAQAVGEALGAPVVQVKAVQAEQLTGVELLVVGSPTRQFNATPDMMAWLNGLAEDALKGARAAAFDTRIDAKTIGFFLFRWLVASNYAVKRLEAALARKGAALAAPGGGFFVKASEGPLVEGELERAATWAQGLTQH